MNKTNNLLCGFLIAAYILAIIGAYYKVNGNENAYLLLAIALILKPVAIIGLIVYNFPKLKQLFK